MASCATSKVKESSAREEAVAKDTVMQGEIRHALEMRRFLVKFDRLYSSNGSRVDLIPKANYIILDGDKVVISAAYVGRQYGFRPIKGIDMVGKAVAFELKNNASKGTYQIRMKVKNDKNTFDVYLTVTNRGYVDTSLNSYRIDHVRYTGNFIPLKPKEQKEKAEDPGDILL